MAQRPKSPGLDHRTPGPYTRCLSQFTVDATSTLPATLCGPTQSVDAHALPFRVFDAFAMGLAAHRIPRKRLSRSPVWSRMTAPAKA